MSSRNHTYPDPISTKLCIPKVRKKLVQRENLYRRLDEISTGRLTLVTAPAGYGKTTLVSAWAQQADHPVTWLSLDENDNELTAFLVYFIEAIRVVAPEFGSDTLNALLSGQISSFQTSQTSLINEIVKYPGHLSLVLDDFHTLSNQSIQGFIERLIKHLPDGKQLIVISRIDPDIPHARYRAGGTLAEIRTDDLKFSLVEAEVFLNQLMSLELRKGDVSALKKRTEGWIAGLQLAALSIKDRPDKHEFVSAFSGSHYYIIDYLMEEVISRQTEEIRGFLFQTSVLDRFCSGLCDYALNISNSRRILRYLEESNLFLIPLDNERCWYRYHHLFSEFLQLSLLEENPQVKPEVHFRAGKWFQMKGLITESVEQFLQGEGESEAAELVETNSRGMLERSELAKLMKLVELLPEDQLFHRPWLCIFHTWALRLSGTPHKRVEEGLEKAERAIANVSKDQIEQSKITENEEHRMQSHIYAIRAYQALYSEDILQTLNLAKRALEYRPESGFVKSSIHFALGWAYRFSGDLPSSTKAFLETKKEALSVGNNFMASSSVCRAGYNYVLGGKLHSAYEVYQDGIRIAVDENRNTLPVVGYSYVYLGGIYREWNELGKGEKFTRKGIEQCERVGYIMDQLVGYVTLARIQYAMGDWIDASENLRTARELSGKMKGYLYARRWVEDCQVRLWIAQNELDKLSDWVQNCGLSVDDSLTYNRELEHLILARALLGLGFDKPDGLEMVEAVKLLDLLLNLSEESGWNGKTIEILVLQSQALSSQGMISGALIKLKQALELAEPENYKRIFIDEGIRLKTLLEMIRPQTRTSNYVNKLLAEFDATAGSKGMTMVPDIYEPFSEREKDVLRLLATDLSGPQIAAELVVALSTVRYHTNNIYSKLSVHNRRAAVSRAKELRII